MSRRPGFTLIELLIAMVIIGILATIASSFLWNAKDRALLRSMQTDLRNVAAHQEVYFPGAMSYAAAITDLTDFAHSPGVIVTITYAGPDGWAAQATHDSYGATCGLFTGDAPAANGAPATIPGKIACD